jgi:hypothetical protein
VATLLGSRSGAAICTNGAGRNSVHQGLNDVAFTVDSNLRKVDLQQQRDEALADR